MIPYDYLFNSFGYFSDPMPMTPAGMATVSQVNSASELARNAATEAKEARDRFERLALATQAMWSLMQQKLGITEQELAERITQLDLSDGKLDGKIRRTPLPCPKCKRMNAPRLARCLFCSEPISKAPFA